MSVRGGWSQGGVSCHERARLSFGKRVPVRVECECESEFEDESEYMLEHARESGRTSEGGAPQENRSLVVGIAHRLVVGRVSRGETLTTP